jgi:tetratricopeptide (TPR) repeat protein
MAATFSIWKKMALGLFVAVLVTAMGFGLLEAGLRLFGYGRSTSFFRKETDAAGKAWWRENRWVTAPYFPPQLIRRPQVIRLPVEKSNNAYRIFVLGSSAAMGDPEPAFSLARQLELLLRRAYPKIQFEVANAGITAINSHVVRALAHDCAKLKPDLFIVYEGNNEVIGPYGPGTVFSPFLGSSAAIRAGQFIKSTRTGQLLASLARRSRDDKAQLDDWGGMQMFLKNEIDRDDPRLGTTADLFRENLRDIAESGRDAGASVFLCTVLANQKDFAPFVSRHRTGFKNDKLEQWQTLFASAIQQAGAGDTTAAESSFRDALQLDEHPAELNFQYAKFSLRENRLADARHYFQEALDLDCLRFRTDSRLNNAVRSLVSEKGVEVVDLAKAAEALSTAGVVGDDFLYEHVHLNFQGTYLVARELFDRVSNELLKRGKIEKVVPRDQIPTLVEARRELAYTTYEQAMIIRELQARFSRPPFSAMSDNAERLKLYTERAEVAVRLLAKPETKQALAQMYEQALAANPDDWMLLRNVGMAFVALGFTERGLELLQRADGIVKDDPDTLFALGKAYQALGKSQAARDVFESLRQLEPRYPGLPATVSEKQD